MSKAEQYVYFLRAEGCELIKIGYSADPRSRAKEMSLWSPHDLEILATFVGGLQKERELHERFAGSRIRGEWFRPTKELLALIETVKRDDDPFVSGPIGCDSHVPFQNTVEQIKRIREMTNTIGLFHGYVQKRVGVGAATWSRWRGGFRRPSQASQAKLNDAEEWLHRLMKVVKEFPTPNR